PDDMPARYRRNRGVSAPGRSPEDRPLPLEEAEKLQIRLALETYGSDTRGKKRAARHLGISLSTLYRKMSKLGLNQTVKPVA
ncbi:MAG: helix-turn-helix domain-containing protein, partial [Desulfobacteraceae bacterium]